MPELCRFYDVNGIAYAGEPAPVIKVSGVRPLEDYRLWVRFNTGEVRVVDFKPLLEEPAFAALRDEKSSGKFISITALPSGWTVRLILPQKRFMSIRITFSPAPNSSFRDILTLVAINPPTTISPTTLAMLDRRCKMPPPTLEMASTPFW